MKNLRLTVILFIVGAFLLAQAVVSAQSDAAKEWAIKGYKETDPNKQIEYYTKAISIDPNYAWAYNARGSAYTALKKYNEAIADYTKVIS
ncbi:MAG: tetratricopeptide repeat protein, partial [Deltaproteobacteria bacterium]|nr:tetratricopeptide repeat protein [Candidatus Zymogenus saltonus]